MQKQNETQVLPFVNIRLKDRAPRTDITIPERIEPLPDGYCGLVMTPYGIAFADNNPEARYIAAEEPDESELADITFSTDSYFQNIDIPDDWMTRPLDKDKTT